jgi:recombinational DNA repair protein RecR
MELTLADFVLCVLCASGTLVVLWTLVSRTLHARAECRSLAHRVVCRLCLHAFEDSSHLAVVNCPLCAAVTEKGRSRRLG